MILVVGSLADQMVEFMCARLKAMKLDYLLMDPSDLKQFSIKVKISRDYVPEGEILDRKTLISYRLEDITGIYARFSVLHSRNIDGSIFSREEKEMMVMENSVHLINLLNLFPGTVINRPKDSQSNDSKLYQQWVIGSSLLKSPRTLITNHPERVEQFYDECRGQVIYKSISGVRSIVSRLDSSRFDRLSLVRHCPTQFQELVQGLEIRVHVVGEELFATGITSEAIDYRYAHKENKSSQFFELQLPEDIAEECIRLARRFNLLVTGLDLKQTSEGHYYCFEANPSPAFVVYERMTGQPISEAVGRLLAGPANQLSHKNDHFTGRPGILPGHFEINPLILQGSKYPI